MKEKKPEDEIVAMNPEKLKKLEYLEYRLKKNKDDAEQHVKDEGTKRYRKLDESYSFDNQ